MKCGVTGALRIAGLGVLLFGTSGCPHSVANMINPFHETGPDLGRQDASAILNSSGISDAEHARRSLETLATYRRAQDPQPAYPVVQPAEVRLMWIPDHVNKAGDLVPAHYYHLRVLGDRWAVQDAFEIEEQLNSTTSGTGAGRAKPWVYLGDKKR
jgi:hypothetical protein